MTRAPRSRRWWGLLAGGVLVLVAVVWVVGRRGESVTPPSRAEVAEIAADAVEDGLAEAAAAPARSAEVYDAIVPSLVVVRARGGAGAENGLGTGVIVNDEGAIMTAHHVIAGARALEVTFADGTEATAQIAAEDPANDIAILASDQLPEIVVPAILGGGVRVGDEAFAVGHPLGLVGSLSAGVVSGLDRSIPIGGGVTLDGLIQFDAAVNRGSSGGPLLNRDGQVVGIVTALANPSDQGYFIGIGFAVPIGTATGGAGGPAL